MGAKGTPVSREGFDDYSLEWWFCGKRTIVDCLNKTQVKDQFRQVYDDISVSYICMRNYGKKIFEFSQSRGITLMDTEEVTVVFPVVRSMTIQTMMRRTQ